MSKEEKTKQVEAEDRSASPSPSKESKECQFYYRQGHKCQKDDGDLSGTDCSKCHVWLCGYHDTLIVQGSKGPLCIWCLVDKRDDFEIKYETTSKDPEEEGYDS